MELYVNSKLLFFELANSKKMTNFASELIMRRCALERQTLLHKLQLAKSNPEDIPTLFEDRSFSGTVAGEVLYLSKCGVTAVRFRRSEHCWDAIPVTEISTNRREKCYVTAPLPPPLHHPPQVVLFVPGGRRETG